MTKEQIEHRLETKLLRIVDLQKLYYESVRIKEAKTAKRILERIFDNKKKSK